MQARNRTDYLKPYCGATRVKILIRYHEANNFSWFYTVPISTPLFILWVKPK